jgi:hypothetical protein
MPTYSPSGGSDIAGCRGKLKLDRFPDDRNDWLARRLLGRDDRGIWRSVEPWPAVLADEVYRQFAAILREAISDTGIEISIRVKTNGGDDLSDIRTGNRIGRTGIAGTKLAAGAYCRG